MKKIVLISSFLCLFIFLNAQTLEWLWAENSGGTGSDMANDIATDSSGNSYVTGVFQGSATFGGTVLDSMGGLDIFIGKMDPLGDWLWAVRAGGSGTDIGSSITVDPFGNCFVTGSFQSNAGFGSNTLYGSGGDDVFVAKLSTSGEWLWSIEAGSSGTDSGKSIALDADNNCYITGSFSGTAFFSALSVVTMGGTDIFVAKASPTGTWLQVHSAGGMSADNAFGIDLDGSGNCYVTGSFTLSADFGSHAVTGNGSMPDVFVAKLSPAGIWQWVTRAGDSSNDVGNAIVVDDAANCYVAGRFMGSTANFGSTNLSSAGGTDIFVAKLNSDGAWQWAVRAGGGATDIPYSIAHGGGGEVYITGYYNGTANFGSTNLSSAGGLDVFLAKLNGAGEWQWAVSAGGADSDYGNGVAIDNNGNCLVVGGFTTSLSTSDFGSHEMSSSGSDDVFVAKYGEAIPALAVNPVNYDFGSTITPGESGSVFINCYMNSASAAPGAYLVSAVLTGDDVFTLSPTMTDATGGSVPGLPAYIYGSGMVVFEVEFEPYTTSSVQAVLTLTDEFASTYTTTINAYSGTVSPDPLILVNPTNITRSIPLNTTQNGSFMIYNQGGGDLNFSILSTGTPDYFTLIPMMGTVAPGDSTQIQYSLSSVGMAAGTYNSSIEIDSNDPVTPTLSLPTHITVLNEVALSVSPTVHDFGICQIDETYQYGILIEAMPSAGTVTIQDIQLIGGSEWGYYVENHPGLPFSLISGETDYIWAAFTPSYPGQNDAQLVITTAGGIQYRVDLTGTGQACDLIVDPTVHRFWDTITPGETGQVVINVKRNPVSPNYMVVVDLAELLPASATQFQFLPDVFNGNGIPVSLPYELYSIAPDSLFFTVVFQPVTTSTQSVNARFYDSLGFYANTFIEAYGGGITWDPEIAVQPDSVDIYINQDSVQSGSFLIRNVGGGSLDYLISPTGLPPNVSLNNASGSVSSGSSATIIYTVDSSGMPVGYDERTLSIQSNDPANPTVDFRMNIHVLGDPIVADFSAVPLSGHAPLTVVFDDQSTVDASLTSTTLTAWRWDFDNDGIIDSYQQNPTHVYTQPGVYSVRLIVMTNNGQFASETKLDYISVSNQAPIVHTPLDTVSDMLEDTPWGPVLLSNHFSDPDGDPLQYTAQNSAHISIVFFAATSFQLTSSQDWYGTESVSITATDPFGASVTMTILVTVQPVNDAPILSVPANLYFIRNSTFVVDFGQYINDPDNPHSEISILIQSVMGQNAIQFAYTPVNAPNIQGQLSVAFTSLLQQPVTERFRITVNDNMGRAIAVTEFFVNLLDHFDVQFGAASSTGGAIAYSGQTVNFRDNTLGNPDWWNWQIRKAGIVVATSDMQHPVLTLNEGGTYSVQLQLGNDEAQEQATHQILGMFTLQGTAVDPGALLPIWDPAGSPYNVYDSLAVGLDETVEIDSTVVVNIFTGSPFTVLGTLNANGVRFQPQTDSGRWQGFHFVGGGRPVSSELTDCVIVNALEPIVVEDSSPTLQSVTIAVTDTLEYTYDRGVHIRGNSGPIIDDLDISNYRRGIEIDPSGDTRTTPVLTNIRVRNSTDTSRTDPDASIGIYIKGEVLIEDADIDDYDTGIVFEGSDQSRTTTPVLTNIRVRNSTDTSRSASYGIMVTGDIVPSLTDVQIEGADYGIKLIGGSNPSRTTPVLTNIRVRNSTDTSRNASSGLLLENISSAVIDSVEVDGFALGIVITSDTRDLSTPVLTNIRVRNSTDTSREESVGLLVTGAVQLSLDNALIEDYPYGIKYQAAPLRDLSTPVLTNIRVRNSTDTSRQSTIGIQLIDLNRVVMDNDSIVGYQIGLQITTGGMRDLSTPVLTNIRVRNSTDTSRTDNVGIFLGPGVGGSLEGAEVYEAQIGILIADGNSTRLKPNLIRNCEIGIRAAGINTLPIRRQLILLDSAFQFENPLWNFCAMELNMPGPWLIENNTINGYPKALKANQAGILYRNNIAWNPSPMQMPFELISSALAVEHCDIATAGAPYPGINNLNLDPQYANVQMDDWSLSHDSPLIDAGSPLVPPDVDGTLSDIGAFTYLHRVNMIASLRFIQTGTTVNFTNLSTGHDQPYTLVEWDLNDDGIIDGNTRNWSYQFNTPGVYDLRLRMSTGSLVDERVFLAAIVVQNNLLQAPQNVQILLQGNNVMLDWDPVELTQQGDPIAVEFYVIYSSPTPDGYYDLVAFTSDYYTIYIHENAAMAKKRFYIILGYAGTRGQLDHFIEENRRILIPEPDQIDGPRRKK